MKVLVNGGLNVSVLDGWWAEAYEPDVGWAIGDPATPSDDARDAAALTSVLQDQVVPLFYDRDAEGLPRAWLRRVRASLSRLTPRFAANRMMGEYLVDYYRPAEADLLAGLAEDGAGGRALAAWAARLRSCWAGLRFGALDAHGTDTGWQVSVELFLNEVPLDAVAVELYAEPPRPGEPPAIVSMTQAGPLPGTTHGFLFRAGVGADRPVSDWTPRVRPVTPAGQAAARMPGELPLVTWQR